MNEMVQGDLLGPKKCLIIYLEVFITATCSLSKMFFRSARTSCRTFEFPTRPVPSVRNNFSRVHIYRHTCLMNHQKSHQTNLMAQRDPIDAPLTPWDPVGLHLDPLGPCRPTP